MYCNRLMPFVGKDLNSFWSVICHPKSRCIHHQISPTLCLSQVWDECYTVSAPMEWKTWPDAGPAVDIPFPKSKDLVDYECVSVLIDAGG